MKRVLLITLVLGSLAAFSSVAFARTGGPDAGGYTFIDNEDPLAGPVFNFLDISSTGTSVGTASNCDDCVSNIPIGFPFTFYGAVYNSINVSSNGNAQFVTASIAFSNSAMPAAALGPAILPFWDDLHTGCPESNIFSQVVGSAPQRRLIIQWDMTRLFAGVCSQVVTFHTILFEGTNEILFQYSDTFFGTGVVNNNGGSATVGIQGAGSGAAFLQYSFNEPVITNGLSICFRPAPVPQTPQQLTTLCRLLPQAPLQVPPVVAPAPTATVFVPGQPGGVGGGGAVAAAIAGAAAQQARENRAAAAAAAAPPAPVAPPATGGGITPPSTGDAGLVSTTSTGMNLMLIGIAALAVASVVSFRLVRR